MDAKKKEFVIFYLLLFAYTLFAVVAHLHITFQIFMFAIIIIAPIIFNHTKTVALYFYTACFMACLGSGGFLGVLNVSLLLLEIKIIWLSIKDKKFDKIKTIIYAWLILLIVLTAYSLIYNRFKIYRMVMFLDFVQCVLTLFLIRKDINIKPILVTLFIGICCSVITAGSYVLLDYKNPFIAYNNMRFGGFFRNINTLSVYCTVCASSFIVLLLNNQIDYKKYIYFPIIATLIGLLTYSKAFILVSGILYATWMVMAFIQSKNKKRLSFYFICGFVIVLAGLILARNYIWTLIERFFSTGHTNFIDNLTSGRREIWSKYIDNWLKSPLTFFFGNGYTSEKIRVMDHLGYSYKYEHSIYIAFLNQFGLIGSIAIIYLIVKTLKTNGKLQRKPSCYIPLGVLLINGISSNLSGILCSCLIWFMALYFTTDVAENTQNTKKTSK